MRRGRPDPTLGFSEGRRLLRAAIKTMKMTDLAARLHVAPSTLSGWLSGERRPDIEGVIAVEDELGISVRSWTERANFALAKNEDATPESVDSAAE